MRILVTGHRGYLGSALVPLLADRGHALVGLDTEWFEDCTFGDRDHAVPRIRKDVRNVEAADVAGFDAVVHLAALSNDPLGDLDPRLTDEINHLATVGLARLARGAGVRRFVFSSSCSVYGAAGDDLVDESAVPHPVTPYARSKMLAERDLRRLATDTFSPVFLRNATAYGVSSGIRFDLVLNNLVAWAFTTGRVLLKSDGTPWRPLVHVEDIAQAFCAVLDAPPEATHNETYNVGSTDQNHRMLDLAEIVTRTVPGSHVVHAEGATSDERCYRVDFGKIRRALPSFAPSWTVERGAEEVYHACRRTGVRAEEFEGPRYARLPHIQALRDAGRLDSGLRWKEPENAP